MEMEHEVDARIPLVSSTALYNGFVPESMESYLTATADISVWACGYHWIRAVASLHAVSIVVVIHSFDYVQLFCGDSTHPRVFLYKTDVETHYDALVPNALVPNTDGLSQNNEASSPPPNHSLSSPPAPSAPCAPLSAEDLRAARVKALNLQQSTSAAASTDQDELVDSVAASSLLSLRSAEEVVVVSSESSDDGWTKNEAYEAYVAAVCDAGRGSWDRQQVMNEIGNRASFNFPSWRRLSELDRLAKINSVISTLRKMVRSAQSALSSVSNAGDHRVGVVVYTSVFECSS
jgi:hypothetical protein